MLVRSDSFLVSTLILLGMAVLATGCASGGSSIGQGSGEPNTLSEQERAAGWMLLFDGSSFDGWRGLGQETFPEEFWRIENGTLRKVSSGEVPRAADGQPLIGRDIITEETFRDFELYIEWKIAPGTNSGIKYSVSEMISTEHEPTTAALGLEYQVLDDDRHPDALNGPHRTTGALYDLVPPNAQKSLHAVGEFNSSRIIFNGSRGEHWLNGERVVSYDLTSEHFASLLEASKYSIYPWFADKREGHIVLQDHGDEVWYRNIKIRRL